VPEGCPSLWDIRVPTSVAMYKCDVDWSLGVLTQGKDTHIILITLRK
jgi:hypothetical protein